MIRILLLFLVNVSITYAQVRDDKPFTIAYDSASTLPIPTIKRLIKVGAGLPLFRQSSVSSPWKSIGLDAAIEQKITQDLSILGGIETNYGFSRNKELYTIELPVEMRYYFSIGRRMKNRVDRHSMFRYYIAYHTYNALFSSYYYKVPDIAERYYRGHYVSSVTNIGKYDEAFNFLLNAYFQVGYQMKINESHYLDVNAVVPITKTIYNKQDFTLSTPAYVTIRYGLFWSK